MPEWFRRDREGWTGELSTDQAYLRYLRSCPGEPVPRRRFGSDLGHLGVQEVLDDDTHVLVRD